MIKKKGNKNKCKDAPGPFTEMLILKLLMLYESIYRFQALPMDSNGNAYMNIDMRFINPHSIVLGWGDGSV